MTAGLTGRCLLVLTVMSAFLGVALTGTASAMARITLVSSSPSADSSHQHMPHEVELRFSEPLTSAPEISVTAPDGTPAETGPAVIRDDTARLPVHAGSKGRYTVTYSATGADGRTTNGSFAFTITTGTGASPTGRVSPPARPAESAPAAQPSTAPVEELVDLVSPPQRGPAAEAIPVRKASEPIWWTFAATALIIVSAIVVLVGFSRRRAVGDRPE